MFSIKVAYKGKNIALPRGINSLLKIEDELKNRFPGEFPNGVTFKYQNIEVESFEHLHTFAPSNGGKSLKISAEPTSLAKSSQIKAESQKSKIDFEEPSIQLQNKEVSAKEESGVEVEKACEAIQEGIKTQRKDEEKDEKIVEKVQSDDEKNNFYSQYDVDCVETICIELEEPEIPQNKVQKIETPIMGEEMKENIEPVLQKPEEIEKVEENEVLKEEEQKVQNYPSYISNEGVKEVDVEELREIEPGVYECVFCKELQLCNVCDTKRKIGENSKLIKIINKIVEKKIDERLEDRLQRIEQQIKELHQRKEEGSSLNKYLPKVEKKEEAQVLSSSVLKEEKKKFIDSVEEITDNFEANKKNVGFGEEFFWTFNIKRRNSLLNCPQQVQIMDHRNLSVLKTFEIAERETVVEVGPFKADKQGQMERTFRLSITNGDEIILFGQKFGFNVQVTKQKLNKSLSNNFRIELERMKKGYRIERSTEYLIEKLKQIGINEQNFEDSKEFLPDILQTV